MSLETAGALSLKSGFLSVAFLAFVTCLATILGFAAVPLSDVKPHEDAARRVASGLLCAFILGLPSTIGYARFDPTYLPTILTIVGGSDETHRMTAYVLAATPFFAVWAILGFWFVAALMHIFTNRPGKDLIQVAQDIRNEVKL